MRRTLKRLAKLTAGYSLVTLAGPIFTVLLTPLYTRVLKPADYGVVDVTLTLGGLITPFVMLGLDGAVTAYFFDGDATHQRNLVTTATLIVVLTGLLAGMGVALTATPLAELLFKDPNRRSVFYLLAVILVNAPVYTILNAALRLQMVVKRVNALALSTLLANVTANIIFVLVFRLKATGIIAANTVVSVFSCSVALALARRSLHGRVTTHYVRPLLRVGIGLVPGALSVFALTYIDRLLLTQYVPQNDIGLYSIANKISSLPWIFIGAAWTAWAPLALEMADKPDAPRQYAHIFEYFIAGSMLLALGFGLFAPEILAIFTTAPYVPAAPYALVLLISTCPITLAIWSMHIGLYARKQTGFISGCNIIGAVANIVLNLILCPFLGVWGAVVATVLAGAVIIVPLYIASQRALPVYYRWKQLGVLGAIYLGLTLAFLFLPPLSLRDTTFSVSAFAFKTVAWLSLAAACVTVGVVSPAQIQAGLAFAQSRLVNWRYPES